MKMGKKHSEFLSIRYLNSSVSDIDITVYVYRPGDI